MRWLKAVKDSPNYPRLKESVEYRFWKRELLGTSAVLGGILFLITLFCLPILLDFDGASGIVLKGLLAIAAIYLPIIGYYGYQWLAIFRHIDSYTFCETVLDRPHMSRYGAGYTVEITDRRGSKLTRDTTKMFRSESEPYLEEYNNQKVLVGYNEETDRVAVICRLS